MKPFCLFSRTSHQRGAVAGNSLHNTISLTNDFIALISCFMDVASGRNHPGLRIENRARKTEDFTWLYKIVRDPWNISKRIAYYQDVWRWIVSQINDSVTLSCTDVGCGVGAFLKAFQEQCPQGSGEGIEYSEEAARQASDLTGLRIHVGDIRLKETFASCSPARIVTFNDVLYYLGDEWRLAMSNCLQFLRPEFAIISMSPNTRSEDFDMYRSRYTSDSGQASLVDHAGNAFPLPESPAKRPATHYFSIFSVKYE